MYGIITPSSVRKHSKKKKAQIPPCILDTHLLIKSWIKVYNRNTEGIPFDQIAASIREEEQKRNLTP